MKNKEQEMMENKELAIIFSFLQYLLSSILPLPSFIWS